MTGHSVIPQVITDRTRITEDGCWEWTRAVGATGYAHMKWDGEVRDMHRVVYRIANGPIPEGLVVDHLCHNRDESCRGKNRRCMHRRCLNPDHLGLKTQGGNLLAGFSPCADNARKTHCDYGHPFSVENTKWERDGSRRCKECRRRRDRERYARTGDRHVSRKRAAAARAGA